MMEVREVREMVRVMEGEVEVWLLVFTACQCELCLCF